MKRRFFNVSKDELYKLYIIQNLSKEEVAEKVGFKPRTIKKWLNEYDIYKTQDQINECYKRICLQKYGVDNPFKLQSTIDKAHTQEVEEKRKASNVETCLERYGTTNGGGTKQAIEKIKSTINDRYGVDFYCVAPECRNNITVESIEKGKVSREKTCLEKYGAKCNWATEEYKAWYHEHAKEFKAKERETKKKNGTTNTSKPEQLLFEDLKAQYGENNVVHLYTDERYPFECDFYIKSIDQFIELNRHWTHGGHPFDPTNKDDLDLLEDWKIKAKDSNFYKTAIEVWTIRDPNKQKIAKENKLNYLAIY